MIIKSPGFLFGKLVLPAPKILVSAVLDASFSQKVNTCKGNSARAPTELQTLILSYRDYWLLRAHSWIALWGRSLPYPRLHPHLSLHPRPWPAYPNLGHLWRAIQDPESHLCQMNPLLQLNPAQLLPQPSPLALTPSQVMVPRALLISHSLEILHFSTYFQWNLNCYKCHWSFELFFGNLFQILYPLFLSYFILKLLRFYFFHSC